MSFEVVIYLLKYGVLCMDLEKWRAKRGDYLCRIFLYEIRRNYRSGLHNDLSLTVRSLLFSIVLHRLGT